MAVYEITADNSIWSDVSTDQVNRSQGEPDMFAVYLTSVCAVPHICLSLSHNLLIGVGDKNWADL